MEIIALVVPALTAIAVAVIARSQRHVSRKVTGWERAYRDCQRRLTAVEKRLDKMNGRPGA